MAVFVYWRPSQMLRRPPSCPRPPTPWGVRNPYKMGISAEGRQMADSSKDGGLRSAFWLTVLKNSKIAGLRQSRKCSALAISAAARLCRIDTNASDPFLRSLMWSLTPQRERRTSGPENFQSSAKKDFFNTIGTKRISIRRWSMR